MNVDLISACATHGASIAKRKTRWLLMKFPLSLSLAFNLHSAQNDLALKLNWKTSAKTRIHSRLMGNSSASAHTQTHPSSRLGTPSQRVTHPLQMRCTARAALKTIICKTIKCLRGAHGGVPASRVLDRRTI
jgi:hypothetical protein